MNSIFKTLNSLGLTSLETRMLFNERTRDVEGLKVWKDKNSGVIYIDDFYVGDKSYQNETYQKPEYDEQIDLNRRIKKFAKFVINKKMVDFGCGTGDFLIKVSNLCNFSCGIELSEDFRNDIIKKKINCFENLSSIEDEFLDIIVCFHIIEHLPNPLETLNVMKNKIKSGGLILVEVPHANDFLLSPNVCNEFKNFTLWSQHLILHTRESLKKVLSAVGLKNIQIEGIQRYPLSNHLHWLIYGKPGGHKSPLSTIETEVLFETYQNSLTKIDATDTLVAIAEVP